ncbi:MAG: nuclear transport factor 2 family protein [Marmoricola sp.]
MSADLDAIKALKYRYTRCLDSKLWDDFADCLTPDATGDYDGLVFDNRAALVDYMRTNMGPTLISMHQVHHPEITIDGDTATGTWYLFDKVLVPDFDFALEGAAFYSDRYVRTAEGWKIAHTGYRRTYEASWSMKDSPSYKVKFGSVLRPKAG